MNILEGIFSDSASLAMVGLILFAGMFIGIGLLAIHSKPKISKK